MATRSSKGGTDAGTSRADRTDPTPKKPVRKRRGGPLSPKQRATAQQTFLAAFAASANITASCEAAGISRDTIYQWQEHDQPFSLRFQRAKEAADDRLRAEIHRRGVEGWDEDVYQLGKYTGTVRKYSDTLLIFLAKARMPEFREKQQIEHSGGTAIRVTYENDWRGRAAAASTAGASAGEGEGGEA